MAGTAGRVALITAWVVVVGGVAAGAGYLHSLGPPEGPPLVEGTAGPPGTADLPHLQPPPAGDQHGEAPHDQAPLAEMPSDEGPAPAPAEPLSAAEHTQPGTAESPPALPEHGTDGPPQEHAETPAAPLPQLSPPSVPSPPQEHAEAPLEAETPLPPLVSAPPGETAEAVHETAVTGAPVTETPVTETPVTGAPTPVAPEAAPEADRGPQVAEATPPAEPAGGTGWPVTTPGLHGPMPMVEPRPFDFVQPSDRPTEPAPETAPADHAPPQPMEEAHGAPEEAPTTAETHETAAPAHPPAEPEVHANEASTEGPAVAETHEPAPEEHSPGQATEETPAETAASALPHEETPDEEAPLAAPPPEETPHEETPHGETPHEETPHEETPHGETPHEAPAQVAVAESPADGHGAPAETHDAPPAAPEEHASVSAPPPEATPASPPAPAVVPDGPMIAIVIGGLGLSSGATEAAIQSLPGAVTLSFSPYSGRLADWVARARAAGHEVLLDLPMEPEDFPRSDPGPQALMTGLDAQENMRRLDWVLSRSDAIVGVGSYMGSRFAADPDAMRPVLEEIRARGLIYLDTGRAAGGVAASVGSEIGLPILVSDMEVDRMAARQSIDDTLERVEQTALRDGAAVAVGTAYPVTIERVSAWARSLGDRGIALAPISALAAR